jgi:hypothetical protein
LEDQKMRVFSLDQELTLIPAAIIREIHAVLVESPKSPWNANPVCISRGTLLWPTGAFPTSYEQVIQAS